MKWMEMAARIRSLLNDLHSSLSDKSTDRDLANAGLVQDVSSSCIASLDSPEFDHICAIVFDPAYGIVEFLKKCATNDQFKNSKYEALNFLSQFVDKAKKHVTTSIIDIKNVCLTIFTWDKAAKTRSATFPLLIKVLRLAAGSLSTEDLNVPALTDKIFTSLSTPSKLTQTVRQGIYHVLGIITETFPECMDIYSQRLLDVYMGALKQQMTSKTKSPEMAIVAGCLWGLNGLLTSFPKVIEENPDDCKCVFNYAYMGIKPDSDRKRFEVPRAALTLFSKHSQLFSSHIYANYHNIYQRLHYWSLHKNKDSKNIAFLAVESFLREIVAIIAKKGKDDEDAKSAFAYFLGTFKSAFKNFSKDSFTREVSVAIKGFGYLAKPCRLFLNATELGVMFQEVAQLCEHAYMGKSHLIEDKVLYLPSVLESLASIVAEIEEIPEGYLHALQNLAVLLVEHYPIILPSHQFTAYRAIAMLLFSLYSKGKTFRMFSSHVVYQGVLRSCSHPVPNEEINSPKELFFQQDPHRITYKEYLSLWNSLLTITSMKIDIEQYNISLEDRHTIVKTLYEEIVKSILAIVNKLDLSSTREEVPSDNLPSDPIAGLQAAKPKDFQIFFNVVEFGRVLLLTNHIDLFQPWVFTFSKDVIRLSTKHPLVSGLYKLFATCLTICSRIKFFKDVLKEGQMQTDQREETLICYSLFVKFALEATVLLKQFKDDLLASCLSVILSLPKEIVIPHIQAIIPALQLTFKIGLSYLPLAIEGLETLERWSYELPRDVIQPHYPNVLPLLNAYLKTHADGISENWSVKDSALELESTSKKRSQGPTKRLTVKFNDDQPRTVKESTALMEVKMKIIALLGKLGGSVNRYLIMAKPDLLSEKAVAWDMDKYLKFAVPFPDMKPSIYIDDFLQQTVQLCFSSERQTKVSACELLHATVLFMLGTKVQMPDKKSNTPFAKLYKHTFPALLKLSCDIDELARQLFKPLVFQLIHWFTSKTMFGSEETLILLNAILEGISNSTDSSLRDFCAECIKEYLSWSIKQTTVKQQEKHPYNATALLKRLCSLCLHPSSWSRLGACLAFNHIYTVLREEESLVGSFIFVLLVHFVDCLSISHKDDAALGTLEQSKQALTHIERIVVNKAAILKNASSKRKIPRGWQKGTLEEAVDWLLVQCGRPQTEARHKCMELIFRFAPLLKDKTTVGNYFGQLTAYHGSQFIISRFEGGGLLDKTALSLRNYPTLSDMEKTLCFTTILSWFDLLLATLDCYVWALEQRLLKLGDISKSDGHVLFKSVEYFVVFISKWSIYDVVNNMKGQAKIEEIYSPLEIETYNRKKCTVMIRLMNMLQTMIKVCTDSSDTEVLGIFFQIPIWHLIIKCILKPAAIGFEIAELEIMEELPIEIEQLLRTMQTKLPADECAKFVNILATEIKEDETLDLQKQLAIGVYNCALSLGLLVSGYEKLYEAGFLNQNAYMLLPERLLQVIVDIGFPKVKVVEEKNVTPTIRMLGRRILLLAFALNLKVEALISLLLETSPVTVSGRKSSTQKGMIVYMLFEDTINECLVKNAEEVIIVLVKRKSSSSVSMIASILLGMLRFLASKDIISRYGNAVTKAILLNWCNLKSIWFTDSSEESESSALMIITKIMIIGSEILSDCNHLAFKSLFVTYLDMLSSRKTRLSFKARLFDLLPSFSILPEEDMCELHKRLTELVANNFPMKSCELVKTGMNHEEFVFAFIKLLKAFELSGCVMLLKLIISITCNEPKHICEDEISTSLRKFMKCLPVDKHLEALATTFGMFFDDDDCPAQFKKQIMKRICVPLFQCANRVSVGKFFEANIVKIMSSLQAKLSKGSEERFEAQLVLKTGCFLLMETVYVRLGKEELYTKGAAIVEAYCMGKSSTGKELTQEITKLAHNAKKENVQGETMLMELRREYHCAALNVLVAVISCTQAEEKFYTAFLFTENTKKGDYLWENIIDTTESLHFEVVLDSKMERKQQMVTIRKAARAKRQEEMDEEQMDESDEEVENYVSSVHYLTSQYLADSSLSEDVGKFDFSSSLQNVSLSSGKLQSDSEAIASTSKGNVISEKKEIVNLEMDKLNEHECMSAFTSVCMYLVKSGISKAPPKGETQCTMPTWMSALHKKFSDTDTHSNIRLYIAKIIINCDEIFAPYTKDWLYPMMQLVVNEVAGQKINYFVTDLMATMLSWSIVAIPEDNMMSRAMASKLLEFLMQASPNERLDILRNNLEIVKTVVECWKPRLEIPIRCIYDNLKDPDTGSRNNVVGLQLLAIILANGLPPFFPTTGLDEKRFLEAVAANLVFRYRIVYGVAAEVVGMILKYMCEKEKVEKVMESGFFNVVVKKLQDLNAQKKPDQFLLCLFKIHNYDTNIVAKFMNRILFLVPSVHGVYREYCLKLIISRIDNVDDPYTELKSRGLEEFLKHREAQVQFLSLQIVKSVLRHLKPEELLYLLPSVTNLSTGRTAQCRDVVYDICSWIFDNYSYETLPERKKIHNIAKETMIHGLVDEGFELRLKVLNFWSQAAHLATATIDRMSSLLRDLYSPSTEHKFLSYCTFLILEMTSKSPDYERKMFEYSLQECKFEDYRLNSSWKARHRSMLPLFLNTVTSQVDEDVGDEDTNDNIRATQGIAQFTPTQANMGTQGNWMTPGTISDISLNTLSQSTEPSQSSLLFSVGKKLPSALKYRRTPQQLKPVGPNFGKGKLELPLAGGQILDTEEGEDYRRLRRRFFKDQEATRIYFVKRQVRLKKTRQDLIQAQRGRREAQVTIYRSYRKGDLPDIEINYSAIIAPMQALAQRDNNFARTLFTALIRGILHETELEDLPDVKSNIAESFSNIVRTTTQYNPAIIGSVLDIWYLEYENMKLDVEDLVTAATMSKQQNTAILFLEKIISKEASVVNVPASKRVRLERNPPPVNSRYWIKMAELYKSIRDYDSVSGIFTFKLNTREETRLALKAETIGDFSAALKLYEKVYSKAEWPEGNPEQCELDLWDDSIMQCYNNLTRWDQLEQHSLANVNKIDINTIWDDIYKQEHYLPFIIRSKVKKLLEGRKNETALWPFVEATLDKQYPERKELLETRYSADLAVLCILREDYARAAHYYNASMENFIREWATMTPFSCDILQQSLLWNLQKLVEMKEFLDAISKNATVDKEDFMRYIKRWQHRMPDALDSVGVWDDIVCTRTFYMRQLAKKAEQLCDDSVAEQFGLEVGKLCWEGDIHNKLSYVDSICQQGNTSVALKYLRAARKDTKVLNSKICNVKFMQSYFRTQLKIAKDNTGLQSLSTVLNAWEQLEKEDPKENLTLSVIQHGLHCDAAKHVIDTVQQHELVLSLLKENEARTLLRRLNCDSLRPRDVLQSAFEFCFRHLKEAVEKQTDEKSHNYNGCLAAAHLNLAKFCDSYISDESSEFGVSQSDDKFPEIIIDNLLQAMKLGSHEACVLFPKIIPIIESTPDSSSMFRSKVLEVPTWMFLRWISQLVALLDKSEGPAVMDLIFAITKDYPQAVIYPFKVSSSSYVFKSDPIGRKCELAVEKIKALLSEQQFAIKFVAALDLFRDPVATLKDARRSLLSLLKKKDKMFEKELKKLYHDIFDCISDKGRENEVPYGEFHINFAKKHVKDMEKICGKDCSKASKLAVKDVEVSIQSIIDKAGRDGSVSLKHYSPWLSTFNSAKFGNDLEIPGQYTGLHKPLPEYHVKISGFDETVMVLESLRRPKRITIRGNDEKEYKYLVKSGEDLRLDQRIEQLFGIMNEIYKNDRHCNMQRLQLVTYQVVPLTDNLGILEWINNTVTLNDFLFKSASSDDKKTISGIINQWKEKMGGQKCASYEMLYKVPRNEVVRHFDEVVTTIRPDILRQSFSNLSSSAEAFFTLRSYFMRSHAVLCASQYILGIGDRHLKNFMVCMRTGTMIGIDFGYSFGVATQFLPVPELMPFRLTPQMLHLMEPLRENGTFRATMTHVLQALRANPDLLKSVMDIFVKEPSLDWQTLARIQAESPGMQASTDWNWFPKEKLSITLRKLHGDNSACIMRDELMTSVHTKKACFKDMLAACLGDKSHNFRAQSAEKKLSVDDQVSCLIDHAIDSNVMGRTFIGWYPCL